MNGSVVFSFFVALFFALVSSFPTAEEFPNQEFAVKEELNLLSDVENLPSADKGTRVKRFACNILNVDPNVEFLSNTACTAECVAKMKGYNKGICQDGVCVCLR